MENAADVRESIEFDPDYVYLKRFSFSVEKLLKRYPDGVPDHLIAQGLLLSEEEVEGLYESAVEKLRQIMGVGERY